MGIGNIFRHNYDIVVDTIIWETVHEHLEALRVVIEAEINALDGDH